VKTHYQVIIIGAGFGGLSLGARLQESGVSDFILLERADSVGGVWRDNNYPGAACDIPARLYSLSIAPTHHWSRRYPTQPEIRSYVQTLPKRLKLSEQIQFNCLVEHMQWDRAAQLWRVKTICNGAARDYTATYLVTANGGLESPSKPNLPGLDQFAGTVVHTAQWPADLNLHGKKVALIGTGASAIQAGPEIAKQAEQLTIYQRTPPWIIPRMDYSIGQLTRTALKWLPGLDKSLRAVVYLTHELRVFALMNAPLMRALQAGLRVWIRATVKNPKTATAATPNYVLGCKRILISTDWYKMLNANNVRLVNQAVSAVTTNGLIDQSGNQTEHDIIILATGFAVTDNPFFKTLIGLNGVTLSEVINGHGLYLGITSDHLPNFFAMAGNNTATGHNSQIFMLECMADYICAGIAQAKNRGLRLNTSIAAPYNIQVQQKLKNSVWRSGCKSWYQNSQGKVLIIWPGFTIKFWQRTRQFDWHNYEISKKP
jgi:cation diffusion facilitator CzcD-associated flavoprotein CzcO